MTWLHATAALVALASAAAPAAAQTGNPAGTTPGTRQAAPGAPAAHQPNPADRLFVEEAAAGGMAEVELGKLAQQKSGSDPVKEFARRMVDDHSKANQRLGDLAKADGVAVPSEIDREHKEMQAQLQKLSGAAFDRTYILGQIGDHQKTAQLLEWEIGSGQDPQLKALAAELLPIFLSHLQQAQDVAHRLTGQVSQGAAPASP